VTNPQLRLATTRRPAPLPQLLVSDSTTSWQCRRPFPRLCDSGGRMRLRDNAGIRPGAWCSTGGPARIIFVTLTWWWSPGAPRCLGP